MLRSFCSNFLWVVLFALIALSLLISWGQREFLRPGSLAQAICFRVENGASISAVGRALEASGIIRDARVFRIGADYLKRSEALKAGSYLIEPGASMNDVLREFTSAGVSTCGHEINLRIGVSGTDLILRELDPQTMRYITRQEYDFDMLDVDVQNSEKYEEYITLSKDPSLRFRVTLVEGATSWQVVDALQRVDFLRGDINATPPEGSLAPDSYNVARGSDRTELINKMTEAQSRIVSDLWSERQADLPYDTPEQALIMASIVEKETSLPEERDKIAGVFVNRLRLGMKLQTDPSVVYGITEGKTILNRGLRKSELFRITPYNTYKVEGLPPTPIANPGKESIFAVLNPGKNDYLFFVADGEGGHLFAETFREHRRNVAKWRKIERQRKQ